MLYQIFDIRAFKKSDDSLFLGGDLFSGHSSAGGPWVFSASFIDNNQDNNSNRARWVDFEMFEVGGSLTPHGRFYRFE